ncbi:hypothetical protein FH715_07505 [Streptomyces sedi]|uniref:Uncharacterized protein n=1 Tax=Streptomyces sedi TaxID=555059 RepID=A0A5C4V9B5_9ACTN|nr:hypothetical protein FH715_07505 [Streptomyces sedi]
MSSVATEIRSAMRGTLASWAGLVAEEHRLARPARDVSALSRYLCRHIEWLSRHPAAGELVDEISELTRKAHEVAYSERVRRVSLGRCPAPGCDGELVAQMRSRDDVTPSEIACSVSSQHAWPATSWARLARQVRGGQGGGA